MTLRIVVVYIIVPVDRNEEFESSLCLPARLFCHLVEKLVRTGPKSLFHVRTCRKRFLGETANTDTIWATDIAMGTVRSYVCCYWLASRRVHLTGSDFFLIGWSEMENISFNEARPCTSIKDSKTLLNRLGSLSMLVQTI